MDSLKDKIDTLDQKLLLRNEIDKEAEKPVIDECTKFFQLEYKVDMALAMLSERLKVEGIALMRGIVMGGGVGISANMSWRVATDNTLFAMPECAIGFYPDVGGGYHLSQLKGNSGKYLGITGLKVKGADNVKLGIATH